MPKPTDNERIECLEEEVKQLRYLLKLEDEINSLGSLMENFSLTKQEAELLLVLYKAKGQWLPRARLELYILHSAETVSCEKRMDNLVSRVRNKIGKTSIKTLRDIGYSIGELGIEKCREVLED